MELGAGLARARPLGIGVAQRHFLASTRPLRHLGLNHAKVMVFSPLRGRICHPMPDASISDAHRVGAAAAASCRMLSHGAACCQTASIWVIRPQAIPLVPEACLQKMD